MADTCTGYTSTDIHLFKRYRERVVVENTHNSKTDLCIPLTRAGMWVISQPCLQVRRESAVKFLYLLPLSLSCSIVSDPLLARDMSSVSSKLFLLPVGRRRKQDVSVILDSTL